MNAQDFLTGSASVVTALATLIASLTAFYQARLKAQQSQTPSRQEVSGSFLKSSWFRWFLLAIGMGVLTLGILVARLLLPTPIAVALTSPMLNQPIEVELSESGSGSFSVSGASAEVFTAENLRVYVLVHPAEPFAAGWWIQPPAVMSRNGQWTALAWIGNQDFPPKAGDKIDLVVVVTEPDKVIGYQKVSDPKDIQPLAQSDIIQVNIGSTK